MLPVWILTVLRASDWSINPKKLRLKLRTRARIDRWYSVLNKITHLRVKLSGILRAWLSIIIFPQKVMVITHLDSRYITKEQQSKRYMQTVHHTWAISWLHWNISCAGAGVFVRFSIFSDRASDLWEQLAKISISNPLINELFNLLYE